MFDKIKHSIKHTAIYSLGNIASKLVGIVLLPIYTTHFSVSEFGILGILEVSIMILTQVFLLGLPNAFLRFYGEAEDVHRKKSILFTISIFLLGISVAILSVGLISADHIASFFAEKERFSQYFNLMFIIIFLRTLNYFFLSVLRANERSALFSAGNLLKIFLTLGFNVYFVAFAQIGIIGVLYAYLIGDATLCILLLTNIISGITPNFDTEILKESLLFAFPIIFASLGSMILQMGDRYILKLLVNYKEVGLYDLGYRFSSILNVFIINSFSLYFLPQAYKIYREKGDKRYYSKMLTYFVFVLCWVGLGISLFGKEIIKTFALNSDYWPAYKIIPIVVLAYIFSGAVVVLNVGIFLKKRTKYFAYTTLLAAAFNILVNFVLIPYYEMFGAAMATLFSFLLLFLVTYYVSQRLYFIPYEKYKIVKMVGVIVFLYSLSFLFLEFSLFWGIVIKLVLLAAFPIILYFLKFYEFAELKKIAEWTKAASIKRFILRNCKDSLM